MGDRYIFDTNGAVLLLSLLALVIGGWLSLRAETRRVRLIGKVLAIVAGTIFLYFNWLVPIAD